MNTLLAWIGNTDRKAPKQPIDSDDIGSIARTLIAEGQNYQQVILLSDKQTEDNEYCQWLADYYHIHTRSPIPSLHLEYFQMNAMDRQAVYQNTRLVLEKYAPTMTQRSFLLSSGTPAMQLVLILFGHTQQYQARLLDASREQGIIETPKWIELAHAVLPPSPQNISACLAQWLTKANQSDIASQIIGTHPQIKDAKASAAVIADLPADFGAVLILGESGTGKENIARLIHDLSAKKSPSQTGQFLAINCSAITETLLESELFGHKKGAFTGANTDHTGIFEAAGINGTVFLDEIGDMPLLLQTKLLRVLQEKKVRPVGSNKEITITHRRIIAATHRQLLNEITAGKFREDLYYRLNTFEIRLPALRERLNDLPALCQHFLTQTEKELAALNINLSLADDAYAVLYKKPWQGNIRELQNILKRAVIYAIKIQSTCINAELLNKVIISRDDNTDLLNKPLANLDLPTLINDLSYHYYQRLKQEYPKLKRQQLADKLKMSLPTLRDKEKLWET
jgi:transcriptional regulator with PAS, ATPase and Fis domain